LASCKLEVYALQTIRQKLQAGGPETLCQLQVRSNVKRNIEVFSSNQKLVFTPAKKERNLQVLMPNETSTINIAVRATMSGVQRARIHCVDITTKELVQAWLFEAEVDKPLLQRAMQVQAMVGRHTPFKFNYTNPLPEFVTVQFGSSKSHLMEVRNERMAFEANETKPVELYLAPQGRAGKEEVFLYINDETGRIAETLLFKILIKE